MSEKITTIAPEQITAQPVNPVVMRGNEMEVTAFIPEQMAQANHALIEWTKRKIVDITAEHQELCAARDHAKSRKWKFTTLASHANLANKRLEFYQKMLAALDAGYYIVPTFPIEVFAVRTHKRKPEALLSTSWSDTHEQKAELLTAGEGEYKNPFPICHQRITGKNEHGGEEKEYWAERWNEMEFPLTMSKPQIMEMASEAMARRIFDDIGVLPSARKKVDPMIIGRIRDPRPKGWGEHKFLCFILGWHFDTAILP